MREFTRPSICINARFVTQPFTGVQRYCHELSRRFSDTLLLSPGPPLVDYAGIDSARLRIKHSAVPGHAWEQLALPTAIPPGMLLWSPAGSGPIAVRRQVLTIHDVAHLEHPEWYSRSFSRWYKFLLPLLTRRVRRIVTVSQFSKERVAHVLGVRPERIIVTPEGVDPRFKPLPPDAVSALLKGLGINGPYILAVGAVSPRKNFDRLDEAWTQLAGSFPELSLVVVGKTGLRFSGSGLHGELPARTRAFEHVSEQELVALYCGAVVFVYPSLYEGFGLPVLEAMACGTPVITSDVTALPETAGEAAILVDPYSVNDIGAAIRRVVEDETLRDDLRGRGLAHAARFPWERTEQLTRRALEDAASLEPSRPAS